MPYDNLIALASAWAARRQSAPQPCLSRRNPQEAVSYRRREEELFGRLWLADFWAIAPYTQFARKDPGGAGACRGWSTTAHRRRLTCTRTWEQALEEVERFEAEGRDGQRYTVVLWAKLIDHHDLKGTTTWLRGRQFLRLLDGRDVYSDQAGGFEIDGTNEIIRRIEA